MSTNKTKNYQLHSWAAADDFLRSEFNENFTKLDTALTALAGGITEAKNRIRIVVGSYQGDGKDSHFINLGATPRAVWVVQRQSGTYTYHGLIAAGLPDDDAALAANGFTVSGFLNYSPQSSDGAGRNPYRYLAFFWED